MSAFPPIVRRWLFVAVAAIAFLALSGCQSTELRTLEQLATTVKPTTGSERERSAQDAGAVLGKPVYAQIMITYQPDGAHTTRDVFDEVVAELEAHSAIQTDAGALPNFYSADLQASSGTVLIDVINLPGKGIVEVRWTHR